MFDAKICCLVMFGGWANRWLGDTWKVGWAGWSGACTAEAAGGAGVLCFKCLSLQLRALAGPLKCIPACVPQLEVSPIIGPAYACTGIEPAIGPVAGGTEVTVKGLRFRWGGIGDLGGWRPVRAAYAVECCEWDVRTGA